MILETRFMDRLLLRQLIPVAASTMSLPTKAPAQGTTDASILTRALVVMNLLFALYA